MPATTFLRSYRVDFGSPSRLGVDSAGRVYATDPARNGVAVRDAGGTVVGWQRGLGKPLSIAIDGSARIYVGDDDAGRVSVYAPDWRPLFSLGPGVDGTGRDEFGQPGAIAIDIATGEAFVTDTRRHVVRVYSAGGQFLRSIGSGFGTADGQFRTPTGIAIQGGEVLVADQLNYRVQAFDQGTGGFLYCIGIYSSSSFVPPGGGPARSMGSVQGLRADAAGRLYVADAFEGVVRVFDRATGARIGAVGGLGDAPGQLRVPTDVAVDGSGRLFVASANGARLDVWGLDTFSDPERFAPAFASVVPGIVNRAAPPVEVEVRVRVPGYRLADIDRASLRVNGAVPVSVQDGELDASGTAELLLRVVAASLILPAGATAEIMVDGRVSGLSFNARTTLGLIGSLAPPVIAKAFGAASIAAGANTALTFTLTNPNTTIALDGVGFADVLPTGLVVDTPNGSTGSCGGGTITAPAGSAGATLSGATLAPGASCAFAINVIGVGGGNLVNTTGNVTSTNGGTGNTASASIDVFVPDLQLTKSHSGNLTQGQFGVSYALVVTNVGNGATSGTVTVVDTPPASLIALAISGTGWTCTFATLACTRSDPLAAGMSYPPIMLSMYVSTTAAGTVTNTASVSGGGDVTSSNNAAADVAAVALASTAPIPADAPWALLLLVLALGMAGLRRVRRRDRSRSTRPGLVSAEKAA